MIIVDDREATQHPEISELLPDISIARMDAGDYAFLTYHHELQGIERCEIGNLVQKLRSGELESQLTKAQELYNRFILLYEGVYDDKDELLAIYELGSRGYFRKYVFPNTSYAYAIGSLASLSEMGLELIHTPNFLCTMIAIRTIYRQRTKPDGERTLFRKNKAITMPTKLTRNPAVPKLMTLCPRLPEKVAIRLINQYDSIWNILNTEEGELLQIDGFGRGLLNKLKEGVGKDV